MLLKILNGFSQAAIIILAFVLIVTITNKHASNLALEDFQSKVDKRFEDDKKYYDARIKSVQDNLNTYQQTREARAQLYGKRMDELYDLYKKDPSPIEKANTVTSMQIVADVPVTKETGVDKNFVYLESKCNRVDEKIDTLDTKIMSRIFVLEQKVDGIQKDSKSNTRVINTNVNNNSFSGLASERQ